MRLITSLFFLALAALPLSAADFSGKWKIDGDVQGNPVNLDCTIDPASGPASKFTGKCTINGQTAVTIDGTVKGDKVNFAFDSGGYTLTYSGKLEEDKVSGDIEVAGAAGAFSGERAK